MYQAGSDIIGILVAAITIGASIYSAKKERERKRNASRSRIDSSVPEPQKEEPQIASYVHSEEDPDVDELFDFIFKPARQERQPETEKEEKMDIPVGEIFVPEASLFVKYNNGMESVENSLSGDNGPGMEMSSGFGDSLSGIARDIPEVIIPVEMPSDSYRLKLKERIKLSPRDLVVFSEILKPKFKDF